MDFSNAGFAKAHPGAVDTEDEVSYEPRQNQDKTHEKAVGSALHELLCKGEPSAPARIAERYLDAIYLGLKRAFPGVKDSHMLKEAAIDAIMGYIKKPSTYDPDKSQLYSYLLMSAKGDLLNELKKTESRTEREVCLEDVGESVSDLERFVEDEIYEFLGNKFFGLSDNDRKAVVLMMSGEKSSSEFAKVWGLSDLPEEEQQKEVKRNKDRLRKRLRRWGGKLAQCREKQRNHSGS